MCFLWRCCCRLMITASKSECVCVCVCVFLWILSTYVELCMCVCFQNLRTDQPQDKKVFLKFYEDDFLLCIFLQTFCRYALWRWEKTFKSIFASKSKSISQSWLKVKSKDWIFTFCSQWFSLGLSPPAICVSSVFHCESKKVNLENIIQWKVSISDSIV